MNVTALDRTWTWMKNLSTAQKIAVSLIAKDVVGCVMYTSTARSNKDYTPEKRADMANYDLANGIINIGMQLALVKPIEYVTEKWSENKLMKKFYNNLDQKLANTNDKFVSSLLKNKKKLVKGSTALISVVICQYIIKRFISPFLSMPVKETFKHNDVIKPKIYPGETYTRYKDRVKGTDGNNDGAVAQELDVTSFEGDDETNLIKRYQKLAQQQNL